MSSESASPSLHDEIFDLEERTWKALQRKGTDLMPFLTKDAVFVFPAVGMKITADTKPSVTDILHSKAFVPWKTFELSKVDVTPIGAEGAVISYRAIATRVPTGKEEDRDAVFDALCSSVWRLEGDKWMMCHHQQTMSM